MQKEYGLPRRFAPRNDRLQGSAVRIRRRGEGSESRGASGRGQNFKRPPQGNVKILGTATGSPRPTHNLEVLAGGSSGKSAKRRRWRKKRAGFEEVPRLAATTVDGNRLARRWAIAAPYTGDGGGA